MTRFNDEVVVTELEAREGGQDESKILLHTESATEREKRKHEGTYEDSIKGMVR